MALLNFRADGRVAFWCVGCERAHVVGIAGAAPPTWDFDGNPDLPTIQPIIETILTDGVASQVVCRCIVILGQIAYLDGTTHALRGKTVDMVDWPE